MRRKSIFRTDRGAGVVWLLVWCWLSPTMSGQAYGQVHILGLTYDKILGIIAGGGGTSVGGPYAVIGTIGQPVVGQCSGGSYSLHSGRYVYRPPVLLAGDLLGRFYDQSEHAVFNATCADPMRPSQSGPAATGWLQGPSP